MASESYNYPEMIFSRLDNFVKRAAHSIPAINRLVKQRDSLRERVDMLTSELELTKKLLPQSGSAPTPILNFQHKELPTAAAAFKIFQGQWISRVPGVGLGTGELFEDSRITWLDRRCGGFKGKRILELGPFEGGHTYMMAKLGAKQILSIECNPRAFLKCLIAKNALGIDAQFLFGDFRSFLKKCDEKFDFVLAAGVLYHDPDPIQLLKLLSNVTDCFGLSTHFYDKKAIISNKKMKDNFEPTPVIEQFGVHKIEKYKNIFLNDLTENYLFCRGTNSYSYWLTKSSILNCLDALGFKVDIKIDEPHNPHGPYLLLYAYRPTG